MDKPIIDALRPCLVQEACYHYDLRIVVERIRVLERLAKTENLAVHHLGDPGILGHKNAVEEYELVRGYARRVRDADIGVALLYLGYHGDIRPVANDGKRILLQPCLDDLGEVEQKLISLLLRGVLHEAGDVDVVGLLCNLESYPVG